jgi:predicted metalloprotease
MPLYRSVQILFSVLLVLALVPALSSAATPQTARGLASAGGPGAPRGADGGDPVEPVFTDTSYESPLGFSLEWDEDDWEITGAYSSEGYDVAELEPDEDAVVQVWGIMNFGGDPSICIEQLPSIYSIFFDVEDLEEQEGLADGPVGPADDVEFATFEAGESLIAVVVSATEDDFQDQLDAAGDLIADGLEVNPPDLDVDAFSDRVDTLSTDIDRFFNRSLRLEGEKYTAPEYLTYDGPVESECYGRLPDGSIDRSGIRYPGSGPAYCGGDQVVRVDAPWMLTYVTPAGGDVLLAATLAHESGHHLQDLTGWSANYDYGDPKDTFIAEQQADCLAGAYIHSTVLRGIYTQRDVDNALSFFFELGGYEEGVDHGTGEEREAAFQLGYDDGFDACGLYDDEG